VEVFWKPQVAFLKQLAASMISHSQQGFRHGQRPLQPFPVSSIHNFSEKRQVEDHSRFFQSNPAQAAIKLPRCA
jgi:hypothetical protein